MPTYAIPFRTFVDTRSVPVQVSNYFTIPSGAGTFSVRMIEIPATGSTFVVRQVDPTTHVFIPGTHKTFTIITSGTPTTNQALVDANTFITGLVGMAYTGNVGMTIEFTYLGAGSTLFAEDINEITDGTLLKNGSILSRHLNISTLSLSSNLTVAGALKLTGTEPIYLPRLTSDVTPNATTLGCFYYNRTDKQYKGVAEDTVAGTYKLVILG